MIEQGPNPEDLLGSRFGHHLNFWSRSERTPIQRVDLGDAHQLVLELRPAHDPRPGACRGDHQRRGPLGLGVGLAPRRRPLDGHQGHHHPGRARRARAAAPALQPFGAVPPLISDIDLSVRLGGILGRRPHPAAPQVPLGGGPRWSRSAGTAAGSM
jgi:methanethiol oxidase